MVSDEKWAESFRSTAGIGERQGIDREERSFPRCDTFPDAVSGSLETVLQEVDFGPDCAGRPSSRGEDEVPAPLKGQAVEHGYALCRDVVMV
jgi:hypothetical protein